MHLSSGIGKLSLEIMMRKTYILTVLLLFLPPPAEENLRTANFKYYINFLGMQNWWHAQSYCRNYDQDMLSIRDEEDNRNFLYANGWLGLYRENSTSKWKWSRGDEVASFLIWNDGKESGHVSANSTDKLLVSHVLSLASLRLRFTLFSLLIMYIRERQWFSLERLGLGLKGSWYEQMLAIATVTFFSHQGEIRIVFPLPKSVFYPKIHKVAS